jgi:hypothetical protein
MHSYGPSESLNRRSVDSVLIEPGRDEVGWITLLSLLFQQKHSEVDTSHPLYLHRQESYCTVDGWVGQGHESALQRTRSGSINAPCLGWIWNQNEKGQKFNTFCFRSRHNKMRASVAHQTIQRLWVNNILSWNIIALNQVAWITE